MGAINGALSGVVDISGLTVTTPIVENLTLAAADTEYSHTFPSNTKYFKFQNRENGLIKYSYSSGTSGTTYFTLFPGQQETAVNINTSTITIYFQSPKSSQLVEMVSWS